jgi:2-oxoglutarate ferredoxin oxidoreductase subunit beta
MKDIVHSYLRPKKKFPHIWCPGCGNGIVMSSLVRAIDSFALDRNDVVLVSGIGCSSRTPIYLDFSSLHGTHGRALAFATGIKFSNPRLKVIVISGDGDALAIGGNHFIHAARRNMDLTVIVYNNSIYGMTGGQYSPTTPPGAFAATAPYGNVERSFDICKVARDAGAVFVARATVAQPLMLQGYIKRGIEKKGFAVIDAVTPCPALYSFFNRTGTGVEMMKSIRERSVTIQRLKSLPEDSRKEKIVCGVFADRKDDEYNDIYNTLMEKAKTEQEGEESL